MLIPRLSLFFALLAAVVASQLPEFAQQYRQRLGGAIDELSREVAQFDSEAQAENLTTPGAIGRLLQNPEVLAQKRGMDMDQTIGRLSRLEHQRDSFAQAGPLTRIIVLARDFDAAIAARAYASFEPAVPTTSEGVVSAVIGFFAGTGIMRLFALPFRRRHPRAALSARAIAAEAESARARAILLRERMNRYTLPRATRDSARERT